SFVGNVVIEPSPFVEEVYGAGDRAVYEIAVPSDDLIHPSGDSCVTPGGTTRVQAEWSMPATVGGGSVTNVRVATGFRIRRMEVTFRPSVVESLPESIDVISHADGGTIRLNQDL